jgi:cob(I)alamin adenosyltransferase
VSEKNPVTEECNVHPIHAHFPHGNGGVDIMVRLTKIYTRTGDRGTTRLVGGQEVSKDDLRIEAYGVIDELNALLGVARTLSGDPAFAAVDAFLLRTQNRLFDLGSDLATRLEDRWEGMPLIDAPDIARLEAQIDTWNAELDPLESFVIPGNQPLASQLHVARTVCRRAERRMVTLAATEDLGEHVIPWINRLSDALFVLSRWVTLQAGWKETLWVPSGDPLSEDA